MGKNLPPDEEIPVSIFEHTRVYTPVNPLINQPPPFEFVMGQMVTSDNFGEFRVMFSTDNLLPGDYFVLAILNPELGEIPDGFIYADDENPGPLAYFRVRE
jgi:hypothetical protein